MVLPPASLAAAIRMPLNALLADLGYTLGPVSPYLLHCQANKVGR